MKLKHLCLVSSTVLASILPTSEWVSANEHQRISVNSAVLRSVETRQPVSPKPITSVLPKRFQIYLNGYLALESNGMVQNGTTYMPLSDLQTLFSAIGIQNRRTANEWQWMTPTQMYASTSKPFVTKPFVTKSTKSTTPPPAYNKYLLTIDKIPVTTIPELVVKNPTVKPSKSSSTTTLEPIYYVMQALKKIGFDSKWDGQHWDIRGVVVYGRRKFPYPYQAMLAIASDADHETLRKFNLVHQFLNTTQQTPMGPGLGLDIADTVFMYNGSDLQTTTDIGNLPISAELSYFRGTSSERYAADVIDRYIHAGWIDGLHTFGDFSMQDESQTLFNRTLAVQAIQALKAAGDELSVWIDHGNRSNVDNFGAYGINPFFNYQKGANPWETNYYHTDVTIPYGIRFVWADLPSDDFGMDSMIYPLTLPDGQKVWGFWRFTNDTWGPGGSPEWLWSADNLYQEISQSHLNQIIRNHQYAIVAQHFCANNTPLPFSAQDIAALRNLADEYLNGDILVARTSRLLNYNVADKYLRYTVTQRNGQAIINIQSIDDPVFGSFVPTVDDVRGITFYTSDASRTKIQIHGVDVNPNDIQRNVNDGVAQSIGIRWFSPDTTDYSVQPPGIY